MPWVIREYADDDFAAMYALDQLCFEPGVAYSREMLRFFLNLATAVRLVADDAGRLAGFVLGESASGVGHVITLDVAVEYRRAGLGSALIEALEQRMAGHGVRDMVLETSVENPAGIAFWERHGYRSEAVLKKYYLRKVDGLEMWKRI